jgi:hypothetical protein
MAFKIRLFFSKAPIYTKLPKTEYGCGEGLVFTVVDQFVERSLIK